MIKTLFFSNSIPIVVLMRRTAEMDTAAPGTLQNPKAAIYAHSSLMSCQCVLKGEKWITVLARRRSWQTRLLCKEY